MFATQMEAETAVRGSVGTSRRILDEAFQTGTAILGSMASQRDTLKVGDTIVFEWHAGGCQSHLLLAWLLYVPQADRECTTCGLILLCGKTV